MTASVVEIEQLGAVVEVERSVGSDPLPHADQLVDSGSCQ